MTIMIIIIIITGRMSGKFVSKVNSIETPLKSSLESQRIRWMEVFEYLKNLNSAYVEVVVKAGRVEARVEWVNTLESQEMYIRYSFGKYT